MWRILSLSLLLCCTSGLVSLVYAADEEAVEQAEGEEVVEGEEAVEGEEGSTRKKKNIYIPIKPAFVVNYGGAGKLKYIKADISLRVSSSNAGHSVRHHMPYIRNNLVMLLTSQTDESIGSQEGKEELRKEALQIVKDVLHKEDRQDGVTDLYFNNFLIQK